MTKYIENKYQLIIDDDLSAPKLAEKLRQIADKLDDFVTAGEGWNAVLKETVTYTERPDEW